MNRHDSLRRAERTAEALFARIESEGLLRPGRTESSVNADIHQLAETDFGATTHWHKRIVRAGRNTLCPYDDNPDDLVIQDDDIVFIDLGPVFEGWEADFGKSYVFGNDEDKHRIVADGEECWTIGKKHFDSNPNLTAEQMFAFMEELAAERDWSLGQWHSGHLVGDFPHDRPPEKVHNFIMPGNDRSIRGVGQDGQSLEWILEVHFVDKERGFGSFFEQLLSVP